MLPVPVITVACSPARLLSLAWPGPACGLDWLADEAAVEPDLAPDPETLESGTLAVFPVTDAASRALESEAVCGRPVAVGVVLPVAKESCLGTAGDDVSFEAGPGV